MDKDYENVAEFFYSKASSRVKKAIEDSGLRQSDVLPSDTKQISRIITNTRRRNNAYLINNSALETSVFDDETRRYIKFGLVSKLSFNSEKEVLWGTDDEIRAYIHDLFFLLWNEVCVHRKRIDSELYLCDYIPYAKYSTYWKIIFESDTSDPRFSFVKYSDIEQSSTIEIEGLHYTPFSDETYNNRMLNFPAILFRIKEDTVVENIEPARNDALEFLYHRCEDDFFEEFIKFAKNNNSFHMLNNIIRDELVEKVFLPLMEKHKPDEASLGLRVKNLINEDLSYCAALACNRNIDNPGYRKQLIGASSDYIRQLEKIQLSAIKKERN